MSKYEQLKDIPIMIYIIVFGIGIWGAILNFFEREEDGIKRNNTQKFGIFLLDLVSSMGLSVITFLSVIGMGYNEIIAVAFAGWIAHQGTRAIYLLELIIAEKFRSKTMIDKVKDDMNKGKKNV